MYKSVGSTLQEEALHAIIVLPEDKLPILIQFANFLNSETYDSGYSVKHTKKMAEERKKLFGKYKGSIQLSDDFNETPDCFSEYM